MCVLKKSLCWAIVWALACSALADDGAIDSNTPSSSPAASSTTTPSTETPPTTTSSAAPTTAAAAAVTPEPSTAESFNAESFKKFLISENIPTCQTKDLNECIRRSFNEMMPRLKGGSKELNIPPIDPFTLNRTTFQYSNGPVSGRITMKNALVHGFGNLVYKSVDSKESEGKTRYLSTAFVPSVNIVGNYKADVLFNNVQLRPRGTFNVTLTDIDMVQKSEGSFYEKDGHRFIRLSSFDVTPEIGGLQVHATGLFPDPTLNEIVLNIINQYWKQIYRVMLPETRQYWGPLLLRLINQTLSFLPYDLVVKEN